MANTKKQTLTEIEAETRQYYNGFRKALGHPELEEELIKKIAREKYDREHSGW